MNTDTKLTTTQMAILVAAARRPNGEIEPLPDNLRGGARVQVVKGLLAKGFVFESDGHHVLTDAGYAAVGKLRPVRKGIQKIDAPDALTKRDPTPPTIRPGTKICEFRGKLDTDSAPNWTVIPAQTGHGFRGKLDS